MREEALWHLRCIYRGSWADPKKARLRGKNKNTREEEDINSEDARFYLMEASRRFTRKLRMWVKSERGQRLKRGEEEVGKELKN